MSHRILITLIYLFLPDLLQGQTNHCQLIEKCNLCIGTKGCVWCNNHRFEGKGTTQQIPRCETQENHEKRNDGFCGSKEFLEIPSSGYIRKDRRPVDQSNTVHISPQTGEVKLAAGKPVSFEIEYLEDMDKALDLYYIMDLSATMEDDKAEVAKGADELAIALRKLSNNVRFGFGSFVDKPLLPFSSFEQLTQSNPRYEKPYGFRNHLPLTSDINKFKAVVTNSKISYNTDVPEGGFDAVMQAIVCNEEIGWNGNRTRLIVIASDGPFHIAGDGRLVGVVRPNDMKCHLRNGLYTHSTLLDYPSVGQLNHVAKKYKTHIIFATTRDELSSYRQLAELIEPAVAAELTKDSNNVVDLVKEQYNDIKGNVELHHDWKGDAAARISQYIDINYEVKCPKSTHWINSRNCSNVGPGEKFRFRATLTMNHCPPEELGTKAVVEFTTFQLRGQEQLRIALELDCICNCSGSVGSFDKDEKLLNSICGGQAQRLQCGQCLCNEDFSGRNCECSKVQGIATHLNREGCVSNETQFECSGRGECICGQCVCSKNQKWGGRYCDCDQSNCYLNPNNPFELECSDRKGTCHCGKCECDEDRFGEQCQCRKDPASCKEPGTDTICSGNGDCSCSNFGASVVPPGGWDRSCSCREGFQGKFCHICAGSDCTSQQTVSTRCRDEKLQACVKCHIGSVTEESKETDCYGFCVLETPERDISQYDVTLKKDLGDIGSREKISCSASYNSTCLMTFTYEYQTGKDRFALKVEAMETVFCPPPIDIVPIIIYAAGGVILVGLLTLLLWKLFTYVNDKREFRKFEKERSAAKWAKGENPLYAVPTSRFENPAYRN